MTSQMVSVDETLSFAHRAGGEVRVRLRVPAGSLAAGPSAVRLSAGRRTSGSPPTSPPTSRGSPSTSPLPAPGCGGGGSGPWRSARGRTPPAVSVEARLLARRDQPVALLPGPVPSTRLPEPRSPQGDAPGAAGGPAPAGPREAGPPARAGRRRGARGVTAPPADRPGPAGPGAPAVAGRAPSGPAAGRSWAAPGAAVAAAARSPAQESDQAARTHRRAVRRHRGSPPSRSGRPVAAELPGAGQVLVLTADAAGSAPTSDSVPVREVHGIDELVREEVPGVRPHRRGPRPSSRGGICRPG